MLWRQEWVYFCFGRFLQQPQMYRFCLFFVYFLYIVVLDWNPMCSSFCRFLLLMKQMVTRWLSYFLSCIPKSLWRCRGSGEMSCWPLEAELKVKRGSEWYIQTVGTSQSVNWQYFWWTIDVVDGCSFINTFWLFCLGLPRQGCSYALRYVAGMGEGLVRKP